MTEVTAWRKQIDDIKHIAACQALGVRLYDVLVELIEAGTDSDSDRFNLARHRAVKLLRAIEGT